MIKCEFGNLRVRGKKTDIMAEYACITESMVENLGENAVRFAFDMGLKGAKGKDILSPEIDGALKNLMNEILKDAFKDDACKDCDGSCD